MVVSQQNNNFAEVLRDLKAQELPSIEFIIIDNASNYRNNVKPNIRYGEKMPEDYCMYHAKELTSRRVHHSTKPRLRVIRHYDCYKPGKI